MTRKFLGAAIRNYAYFSDYQTTVLIINLRFSVLTNGTFFGTIARLLFIGKLVGAKQVRCMLDGRPAPVLVIKYSIL